MMGFAKVYNHHPMPLVSPISHRPLLVILYIALDMRRSGMITPPGRRSTDNGNDITPRGIHIKKV